MTYEGGVWYQATCNAQQVLDEGLALLNQEQNILTGNLRIAAPSHLGRTRLLEWLSEFQLLHPSITPIVQVHDGADNLIADSVDVALRYGKPTEPGFIVNVLAPNNRRVICASPAYWQKQGLPTHPMDLLKHRCLAFHIRNQPYVHWAFAKEDEHIEIKITPALLSNDGAIVRHWARQDLGVMFRSYLDVEDDIRAGHLQQALGDWMGEPCPLYLVRLGNRLWPLRVQAFWNFCRMKMQMDVSA
ncbi:MAG: substrate binding domain-containing protein [Ottowia sp.]|nr:substrate binding domain-containing protein [Ottowia sp.]